MNKRAVLYARVSGDDRHREDRNLNGQLDMCRECAQARDWSIVAELAEDDKGASGAAFELPQLDRVREMAAAGQFDVLAVRELDRLSRSLAKQLLVEQELKRHGIEIEYVLGEYPDTPEGDLMKNLKASIAEYERLKVTERMVRGRQLKVKAGSVLVLGRPPYGYDEVEQAGKWTLEIKDLEADVVRMIFVWYVNGDGDRGPLSVRGIQHKLNSLGVPSPADTRPENKKKRAYGEWAQSTIYRILTNDTYIGVWRYGKISEKDGRRTPRPTEAQLTVSVPAIITPELWQATQSRLAQNRDKGPGQLKYEYLV